MSGYLLSYKISEDPAAIFPESKQACPRGLVFSFPASKEQLSVHMLRTVFRRGLSASGGALVVTTGTYLYTTWDVQAVPVSNSSGPIFQNKYYRRCNPNDNPTVHDLHVLKVPFSQIDPALLENREKLLERYCGGVWGGVG